MAPQEDGKTYLARHFIESRAAAIHPVFGVPSHFNMSTTSYGLEEVHELRETLEDFEEKTGKFLDFDFDVRNCTWDNVLSELARAQEADEKRGKKWHHKAWRALGSTAQIFSPGLSAFPDELCVLHGGLAVIFSIARLRAQHRSKILAAFEDIPNAIMMAHSKAKTFPRDDTNPDSIRLHNSIDGLNQTLLQVLPELIRVLNPDTIILKATSSLKGEKIDSLLERIARSSQHTRDCAECLMDHTIVDMHKTVKGHQQISENIYTNTQDTVTGVDDLRTQVDELLRRQQSLQDTLDAISGKNGLFQFVVELLNNPHLNTPPPPEYTPAANPHGMPPVRTSETVLTALELLNLLDIHLLGPIEEETQILRRGRSIDDTLLSRAAYMLQTTQVRNLLSSPQAGVVLVDACGSDRAQVGTVTPISFICATLTQALRRPPPPSSGSPGSSSSGSVVLVFFCGSHVAAEDPLRGPLGLVRSLLAQLVLELLKNRWVTEEGPMGVVLPGNDSDDSLLGEEEEGEGVVYLADLCGLFHNLLRLVPRGTSVYCIVDGISSYEREDWSEDYGVVMGEFARIVGDEGLGAWFKLLLTSLTSSTRGLDGWMPHQRVSLRSGRAGGGSVQRSVRAAFGDVDLNDDYY